MSSATPDARIATTGSRRIAPRAPRARTIRGRCGSTNTSLFGEKPANLLARLTADRSRRDLRDRCARPRAPAQRVRARRRRHAGARGDRGRSAIAADITSTSASGRFFGFRRMTARAHDRRRARRSDRRARYSASMPFEQNGDGRWPAAGRTSRATRSLTAE